MVSGVASETITQDGRHLALRPSVFLDALD